MKERRRSQLDRYFESVPKPATASRPSLRFSRLGGELVATAFGDTLRLTRRYLWDQVPAAASLDSVRRNGWQPGLLEPRVPQHTGLSGLAALDIETTGLSLGAGTVAFLVGVISADTDGLLLRQFLIRDFSEEAAQQQLIADDLGRFDVISTYNGARFDLPILRSRSVINRIQAPWLDLPHLDLLYPVRAVWQRTWSDCRLVTAESQLLGVVRHDECEGWEVPLRYRQFLTEQSEEPLFDVLEHNAQDLVSLYCLAASVQRLYAAEEGFGLSQTELLALARAVIARGREADGMALYRQARKMGRLSPDYSRHMRNMVRILKRKKSLNDAREIWLELSQSVSPAERYWAYVEEAKYQEHHLKTANAAIVAVAQARQALAQLPDTASRQRFTADLEHRESRLLRHQKAQ